MLLANELELIGFLHLFGQGPEGAVDGGVLIDAADLACLAACHTAAFVVALDVAEAAANEAFLHGVERVPDGRSGIFMAAKGEHLVWGDWSGFVFVAGDECGGGEGALLACGELHAGHAADAFIDLGELFHEGDAAVDDLAGDIAFVRDADVFDHVLCDDEAVAADEAEDACHEAIRAGAVVGIEENDFVVVAADFEFLAVVAVFSGVNN